MSLFHVASTIKKSIESRYNNVCFYIGGGMVDNDYAGSVFLTFFFKEDHSPTWGKATPAIDTANHYVTMGLSHGYLVVHTPDPGMRESLIDILLHEADFGLELVAREVLNRAFLATGDVRTLWLHGIHQRTGIKPDTKTITGSNLRLAIDRIFDQTYSYNSTRTALSIENRDRVAGVNLNESSIWLYRMPDWTQFISHAKGISELVRSAESSPLSNPLDTLSHPISDAAVMVGAYDFAFIDLDTVPADLVSDSQRNRLERIESDYSIEIAMPVIGNEVLRLRVSARSMGLISYIGDLEILPKISNGRLKLSSATKNVQPGKKGMLERCAKTITGDPSILRVWYQSGHAIVSSACYAVNYTQAPFNDFIWALFTGYDIEKEKPLDVAGKVDLSKIGVSGDDSLFSWVFHAVRKGIRRGVLSHLKLAQAGDWLVCDDGSGEVADFIHTTISDGHLTISFIHVKAADSKAASRMLSVGAHDVLINQVVKNLHLLNPTNLATHLGDRIARAANKMAWDFNGQANVENFVDFLKTWAAHGTTRIVSIAVQPHTLRAFYRGSGGNKLQRKQLDSLLTSASMSVAGLNAKFYVIGSARLQ
jgi:hypothetical protein